ncbi:hypothetical protein P3T36_006040 [Kitasatospora sp. MAP12-15]|uniref:SSI family serine proteinase inhibitor n=1 Tax=unclassified Kitasatospora TaxID=2633591 RepID=UPI00247535C5|nr:SSI family serine proteinase inhibitor [Kitasatospora sp. MAP12-44]MDH6109037.1 hypothetical protein [Kitasatospora sp. MAP12-44]
MVSFRIRAALAAAVFAVLSFPTPVQALPAGPPWRLTLAIQDGGTRGDRRVELICHPALGSHPKAQDACDALDRANGDPDRLTGTTGTFCNQLYQPVTASATGSWAGRRVQWQHTFANSCGLHTRTAAVFGF